jgi:hypothetical protein
MFGLCVECLVQVPLPYVSVQAQSCLYSVPCSIILLWLLQVDLDYIREQLSSVRADDETLSSMRSDWVVESGREYVL